MKAPILFLLAVPLLAQDPPPLAAVAKEHALGQKIAAEIERESKPYSNAAVQEYVRGIGAELVSHVPNPHFVYHFSVIRDGGSEPYSIPGGYVLIPAKFLVAVQDEAELAGMLAHAIGHIEMRQGSRMGQESPLTNISTIAVTFMPSPNGSHVDPREPVKMPIGLYDAQRQAELEADQFAVMLVARTGYDPAALRRYIERTQPEGSQIEALPVREIRLAQIDTAMRSAKVQASPDRGEFSRIQGMVRADLGESKQRRVPSLRK